MVFARSVWLAAGGGELATWVIGFEEDLRWRIYLARFQTRKQAHDAGVVLHDRFWRE